MVHTVVWVGCQAEGATAEAARREIDVRKQALVGVSRYDIPGVVCPKARLLAPPQESMANPPMVTHVARRAGSLEAVLWRPLA